MRQTRVQKRSCEDCLTVRVYVCLQCKSNCPMFIGIRPESIYSQEILVDLQKFVDSLLTWNSNILRRNLSLIFCSPLTLSRSWHWGKSQPLFTRWGIMQWNILLSWSFGCDCICIPNGFRHFVPDVWMLLCVFRWPRGDTSNESSERNASYIPNDPVAFGLIDTKISWDQIKTK